MFLQRRLVNKWKGRGRKKPGDISSSSRFSVLGSVDEANEGYADETEEVELEEGEMISKNQNTMLKEVVAKREEQGVRPSLPRG